MKEKKITVSLLIFLAPISVYYFQKIEKKNVNRIRLSTSQDHKTFY